MNLLRCNVYKCKTTANDGIELYKFPFHSRALMITWNMAVNRVNWKADNNSRICSLHFSDNDYEYIATKRVLKKRASPFYNGSDKPCYNNNDLCETNLDNVSSASDMHRSDIQTINLQNCPGDIDNINTTTIYPTSHEAPGPSNHILQNSNSDNNEDIVMIDDDFSTEIDIESSTATNAKAIKQLNDNKCAVPGPSNHILQNSNSDNNEDIVMIDDDFSTEIDIESSTATNAKAIKQLNDNKCAVPGPSNHILQNSNSDNNEDIVMIDDDFSTEIDIESSTATNAKAIKQLNDNKCAVPGPSNHILQNSNSDNNEDIVMIDDDFSTEIDIESSTATNAKAIKQLNDNKCAVPGPSNHILQNSNSDNNEDIVMIDDDFSTEIDIESSTATNAKAIKQLNDNKCAVPLCHEGARNMFDRLFFIQFPNNYELSLKWWKICGRDDPFDPSSKICSIHFFDFNFFNSLVEINGKIRSQTILKTNNIVPTRFLTQNEYTLFQREHRRTDGDKCIVKDCNNTFLKDGKQIKFFRFPFENKPLLKIWLDNIKLSNFQPTESDTICSNHFESNCIVWNNNILELIKNATPSLTPMNPYVKNSTNVPLRDSRLNLDLNQIKLTNSNENVAKKRKIENKTVVQSDSHNSFANVQRPTQLLIPITSLINSADSNVNNENSNTSDVDRILSENLDNNDGIQESQSEQNTTHATKQSLESSDQEIVDENSNTSDVDRILSENLDNNDGIQESQSEQNTTHATKQSLESSDQTIRKMSDDSNDMNSSSDDYDDYDDYSQCSCCGEHEGVQYLREHGGEYHYNDISDDEEESPEQAENIQNGSDLWHDDKYMAQPIPFTGTTGLIVSPAVKEMDATSAKNHLESVCMSENLSSDKDVGEPSQSIMKDTPNNSENIKLSESNTENVLRKRIKRDPPRIIMCIDLTSDHDDEGPSDNVKEIDSTSANNHLESVCMREKLSSDKDVGEPSKPNNSENIKLSESNTDNENSNTSDVDRILSENLDNNDGIQESQSEQNTTHATKQSLESSDQEIVDDRRMARKAKDVILINLIDEEDIGEHSQFIMKDQPKNFETIKLSESNTENAVVEKMIPMLAKKQCKDDCVCKGALSFDDFAQYAETRVKNQPKTTKTIKLSENNTKDVKEMDSTSAKNHLENVCMSEKLSSDKDAGEPSQSIMKGTPNNSENIKLSESNTDNVKEMDSTSAKNHLENVCMSEKLSSDKDAGEPSQSIMKGTPNNSENIKLSESNTDNVKEMDSTSAKNHLENVCMSEKLSSDKDAGEPSQSIMKGTPNNSENIKLSESNTDNVKEMDSTSAKNHLENVCMSEKLSSDKDAGEPSQSIMKGTPNNSENIKLSESNTDNVKEMDSTSAKNHLENVCMSEKLSSDKDAGEPSQSIMTGTPNNSELTEITMFKNPYAFRKLRKRGPPRIAMCIDLTSEPDDEGPSDNVKEMDSTSAKNHLESVCMNEKLSNNDDEGPSQSIVKGQLKCSNELKLTEPVTENVLRKRIKRDPPLIIMCIDLTSDHDDEGPSDNVKEMDSTSANNHLESVCMSEKLSSDKDVGEPSQPNNSENIKLSENNTKDENSNTSDVDRILSENLDNNDGIQESQSEQNTTHATKQSLESSDQTIRKMSDDSNDMNSSSDDYDDYDDYSQCSCCGEHEGVQYLREHGGEYHYNDISDDEEESPEQAENIQNGSDLWHDDKYMAQPIPFTGTTGLIVSPAVKEMDATSAKNHLESVCMSENLSSDKDVGEPSQSIMKDTPNNSENIKLSESNTENVLRKRIKRDPPRIIMCIDLTSDHDDEGPSDNVKEIDSTSAKNHLESVCMSEKLSSDKDVGEPSQPNNSENIKLSENNTKDVKEMDSTSAKNHLESVCMSENLSSDKDVGEPSQSIMKGTPINSENIKLSESNTDNVKEMDSTSAKNHLESVCTNENLSNDDDEGPSQFIVKGQLKCSKELKLTEPITENVTKIFPKSGKDHCKGDCLCEGTLSFDNFAPFPQMRAKGKPKNSKKNKLSENPTVNVKETIPQLAKHPREGECICEGILSFDDFATVSKTKLDGQPKNAKEIKLSKNNTKNVKKMVTNSAKNHCECNYMSEEEWSSDENVGELSLSILKGQRKSSKEMKSSESNTENVKKMVPKSAKNHKECVCTSVKSSSVKIEELLQSVMKEEQIKARKLQISDSNFENVKNMAFKSALDQVNRMGSKLSSDADDCDNSDDDDLVEAMVRVTAGCFLDNQELRECRGEMLPAYCECESQCYTHLSGPERIEIYNEFNKLPNVSEQNCRIAELVSLSTVKKQDDSSHNITTYHLKRKDELITVCHVFFINTLGITKKRIDAILQPDIYSWYSTKTLALQDIHLNQSVVVEEETDTTDFIQNSFELLEKDYDLFLPDVDQKIPIENVPVEEFKNVISFIKNIPRLVTSCDVPGSDKKKFFEVSLDVNFMYKFYSETFLGKKANPPYTCNQFKKIYNIYMKLFIKKQ